MAFTHSHDLKTAFDTIPQQSNLAGCEAPQGRTSKLSIYSCGISATVAMQEPQDLYMEKASSTASRKLWVLNDSEMSTSIAGILPSCQFILYLKMALITPPLHHASWVIFHMILGMKLVSCNDEDIRETGALTMKSRRNALKYTATRLLGFRIESCTTGSLRN